MTIEDLERFAQKFVIDPKTDCWVWQTTNNHGYGYFSVDGRLRRVHRLLYELIHGELPASLVCDHLCRNKACCNPKHIEPVTQSVNIRRGDGRSPKDPCTKGHKRTPDNIYITPSTRTGQCLTCKRNKRKIQYEKFKQAKLQGKPL